MMIPHTLLASVKGLELDACKGYNDIKAVSKSGQILRSVLTKVKDSLTLEKQSNVVVYEITCKCDKVYLDETKSRLETKIEERRDACMKQFTNRSDITDHTWTQGHSILNWNEARVY